MLSLSIWVSSVMVARPLSVFLHRSSANLRPRRGRFWLVEGLEGVGTVGAAGRLASCEVPLGVGRLSDGSLTNFNRSWAFFRKDSAAARRWWFYDLFRTRSVI
jgi:hypothetical protein